MEKRLVDCFFFFFFFLGFLAASYVVVSYRRMKVCIIIFHMEF